MAIVTRNDTWMGIYYLHSSSVEDNKPILALTLMGYALSNGLLLVHFYKFFKSSKGQKLATKNLTSYCVSIFATNMIRILTFTRIPDDYPNMYFFVLWYLRLSGSFLLLVLSFDTCMCLRNTSLYLHHSSGSRNVEFVLYSIFGRGLPAVFVLPMFFVFFGKVCAPALISLNIAVRCICIVLFLISLRYIISSSIDKTMLLTNFPLVARLLLITGVVPGIPYATYVLVLLIAKNHGEEACALLNLIWTVYSSYEGFLIALCFTFKKNLFQSELFRRKNVSICSRECTNISVISSSRLHVWIAPSDKISL